MDIQELTQSLRQFTSSRRHVHSLNVMAAAESLARRHEPALLGQARLAGLLHDNAKRLTDTELLAEAMRFGLTVTELEMTQPSLLHGKVGAALLPERFGLEDPDVAQAVTDHVTGRPRMGRLSRLLYVADQCAADRTFPGVELLREVAREDLEQAVLLVARNKLLSVIQRGYLVEPNTAGLYNEQVLAGVSLPAGVSDFGGQD